MSTEILFEHGIGEDRAALIEDGRITELHIERASAGNANAPRAGDVWDARLTSILVPGRRGIVALDDQEALIEPLPKGVTEGGRLRVAVTRESIPEPGRPRLPKVSALPDPPAGLGRVSAGPSLLERLRQSPHPLHQLPTHGPDRLEAAGWSEMIEEAATGHVAFSGGLLTISLTPAMTVIDVDGAGPPTELALAGARAAASAIRRLDVTGSIGIDLPTLTDKAARQAVGDAVDAILPRPFERTAMNGFGFLQIVRRRVRPSIPELIQGAPVETAALALLRRAEREPGIGQRTITAHPAVTAWLAQNPPLTDELARRIGAAVRLQDSAALPISGGYVDVRPI